MGNHILFGKEKEGQSQQEKKKKKKTKNFSTNWKMTTRTLGNRRFFKTIQTIFTRKHVQTGFDYLIEEYDTQAPISDIDIDAGSWDSHRQLDKSNDSACEKTYVNISEFEKAFEDILKEVDNPCYQFDRRRNARSEDDINYELKMLRTLLLYKSLNEWF